MQRAENHKPGRAKERVKRREAGILTTDERGWRTFRMRNGELIPPSPLPSPPGEGVLRAATAEAQTRRGAMRAATTKSRNSWTQKGQWNGKMFAYVRLCSPMFA